MPEWIGMTAGLVLLTIFSLSGMPIFVAIGLGGIVGSLFFVDIGPLLEGGVFIWKQLNSIGLLALPGFVLMGNIFFQHGFGKDLYDTAYKWLGQIRGGLLYTSTAFGALFGFVSGSMAAGLITVASVTLPEVERRGYDKRLSLGSLSIAGTLSVLIPPSMLMIVYSTLAEVSLGYLFFAGIFPGLLLSALIMAYILIRSGINRSLCPAGPSVSMSEKLRSLRGIAPVIITFVVVLGGIYIGVWSAVEAAASGAVIAYLCCVLYGRATWTRLKDSLYPTLRICAMVYMIMISAAFLNYFIFVSKFDEVLLALISSLNLPNWVIMASILLILTFMGCLFDIMGIMLISVAVFLPVVITIGYDPIWFGIILIIGCELAQVTPPVGLNLYVLKDLAGEGTTTTDVIVGSYPFVFVIWVLFAILTLFPQIALWLPYTMRG